MILPGDILIHAGDLTHSGTPRELQDTFDWLVSLLREHKIAIAGNHDTYLQKDEGHLWAHSWREHGIIYLEDEAHTIQVRGYELKIFGNGSPFTPQHGNGVFQYPRPDTTDIPSRWSIILDDTDILITYGPPYDHLDLSGLGRKALLARMWEIRRTHPPVFLSVWTHSWRSWGRRSALEPCSVDMGGHCAQERGLALHHAPVMGDAFSVIGGLRDHDVRPPVVVDI
ncbi:hypothetical protein DEU56DRAFT_194992 [Suillus clintonianus]|uniref:uncharacterized protein n=1 Tax=Suillus clintonianus TaxID=1904413 RepID=UPI001B87F8BE|nr:uncharacterized protein DEU56DRAFT_194992 [Suillus clintonianus]KAG2145156.1 hypothetical protein DEU56DRAFT_194992 [Suillus clintonianus]